jgi:hypothetical protein
MKKPPFAKDLPCTAPGCDLKQIAKGLCQKHYGYMKKHGTLVPRRAFLLFDDKEGIKAWLLKQRESDERGCWLWKKARTTSGYGNVSVDGKVRLVHRVAAYAWNGFDLESPLKILHSCDNPPCFNPEHLTPGTDHDNNMDAARKGRTSRKLSRDCVVVIKQLLRMGLPKRTTAKLFRVDQVTILNIVKDKAWTHVSADDPIHPLPVS